MCFIEYSKQINVFDCAFHKANEEKKEHKKSKIYNEKQKFIQLEYPWSIV